MWLRPRNPFQIKWKGRELAEAIKQVPKGDFTYSVLYSQIEAAFKWGRSYSEFRDLPYEDRVIMIAYIRATQQMEAIRAHEAIRT